MATEPANAVYSVASHRYSTLVVVTVTDSVVLPLGRRESLRYLSPAQPWGRAMTLVQLALGHAQEPANGQGHCGARIAGGRRIVSEVPVR